MNEYSNGRKGAAIVIHQMFFVLMVCSIYGTGYNLRAHAGGLGELSLLMVTGLVGSFVTLAYLTNICGRRSEEDPEIYLNMVDYVYTDLQLILMIWFVYGVIYLCRGLKGLHFEFSGLLVAVGTIGYLTDVGFLVFYLSMVRRAKNNTLLKHSLVYVVFRLVKNKLFGGSGEPVMRKARERYAIQNAIEAIAEGALDTMLDIEDFHGQERDIAVAVNHIRDGQRDAVMNQIKNERMKADLITNVSHDIKTPLTSIVNYVDLLKRENLDNEKARGYIRILDEKSQRLKQLTEDLVEASKISSGNIRLDMQNIDFVELIYQTGGEFNERFEARGLTIVTRLPNHSVMVQADGRQLYRAIENLYTNAAKYAMENTRVYVTLEEKDAAVVFTIKNISHRPLPGHGDDMVDLTERFVRGEESRTTEGSGLGLSIASSLTMLMGGEFQIKVDGDLFAAAVTFQKI